MVLEVVLCFMSFAVYFYHFTLICLHNNKGNFHYWELFRIILFMSQNEKAEMLCCVRNGISVFFPSVSKTRNARKMEISVLQYFFFLVQVVVAGFTFLHISLRRRYELGSLLKLMKKYLHVFFHRNFAKIKSSVFELSIFPLRSPFCLFGFTFFTRIRAYLGKRKRKCELWCQILFLPKVKIRGVPA